MFIPYWCFDNYRHERHLMHCSQGSELKSPRRMKLAYFGKSRRSRFLPISSRCLLIRFLFGLYEQHNNDFFPYI